MAKSGWKRLIDDPSKFQGAGRFPIPAYSEFMPAPRLGIKPYGTGEMSLFAEDDPWGWQVQEFMEQLELRPGLENIGRQVMHALIHLGQGNPAHGIAQNKLTDNPFWPENLAARAGQLKHERYVTLLPLALSKTQDDKGRVRWTLFGGSEQGPARAFWKSFYSAPGRELPAEQALHFIRLLLHTAYGKSMEELADLHQSGFRILPQGENLPFHFWRLDSLPSWTDPFLYRERQSLRGVNFLLTFRPFAKLPTAVQRAYLAGDLNLLPFPGSLLYWGIPTYCRLQKELPLAIQVPLLHSVARHESPQGIRIPQSGWLHEPHPHKPEPNHFFGPVRNKYKRTNRWARVTRSQDELVTAQEDKLAHVLFSNNPKDLGLYGKPMARNAQIWTSDFHLLLDGPRATQEELLAAAKSLGEGGMFGYRFLFPAMRVGKHEIYWHRLLAGCQSPHTGEPIIIHEAPPGYLTAYDADRPRLDRPIELWPRILQREQYLTPLRLFNRDHDLHPQQTAWNIRKLFDLHAEIGPLPRTFARQLLTLPKQETFEGWLNKLPQRACEPDQVPCLIEEINRGLTPEDFPLPSALTYAHTAKRGFEERYWKTIAFLAAGKFINKVNADCVNDPATRARQIHHERDLDALGDYLLAYYRRLIAAQGMTGKALAGDLPFQWQTEFAYPWSDGWRNAQKGDLTERDIVVVIPGRDRRRAVIMADHYDTAFMEDCYDKDGPRLAASGADDNHSATTALMLGAEVFLKLSKAGQLACDIWLVHLTGEEFPSDCLGARHLCQRLVEKNLKIRLADGKQHDLSRNRVQGLYVLDMIAHNIDHERDIFQISPGTGKESLWLAYQAHVANQIWNASAPRWNAKSARKGQPRCQRSPDGRFMPPIAPHPILSGEVRLPYSRRSTVFNTDAQIFSDAGVPVVLFMENYDINRTGYHDMHDTMENIDLDYGAAVAAITIESVARAATAKPGTFTP